MTYDPTDTIDELKRKALDTLKHFANKFKHGEATAGEFKAAVNAVSSVTSGLLDGPVDDVIMESVNELEIFEYGIANNSIAIFENVNNCEKSIVVVLNVNEAKLVVYSNGTYQNKLFENAVTANDEFVKVVEKLSQNAQFRRIE